MLILIESARFCAQNPPLWIFFQNFGQGAIRLESTELTKAKPRDFHEQSPRNKTKTMKLAQKMPLFGPKSAIMDFFRLVFSNSETLQPYGQNETNIK